MGFRIVKEAKFRAAAVPGAGAPPSEQTPYVDRLKDMIPAVVTAAYVAGQAIIPTGQTVGMIAWAVVCLGFCVYYMGWGTTTTANNISKKYPVDWIHVTLSSIAFIIWVYALGGPFASGGIQVSWIGTLLIVAWTFFIPVVYKGTEAK